MGISKLHILGGLALLATGVWTYRKLSVVGREVERNIEQIQDRQRLEGPLVDWAESDSNPLRDFGRSIGRWLAQ